MLFPPSEVMSDLIFRYAVAVPERDNIFEVAVYGFPEGLTFCDGVLEVAAFYDCRFSLLCPLLCISKTFKRGYLRGIAFQSNQNFIANTVFGFLLNKCSQSNNLEITR